jgi:S1-C subfamily serine protease
MKRTLLLCLISVLAGAAMTDVLQGVFRGSSAVAQDPRTEPATARRGELPLRVASPPATTPLPPPLAGPVELGYTPDEMVNITVYENVNRSVVNINTKTVRNGAFLFFDIEVPGEGLGSGSVLDKRGHVLTNYHVVDGAREIEVTLYNGTPYEGRLIGKDEANDIAVLKIEAPADNLFPVTLGDSARLRVGQRVFAIGNPFGLDRTLTTGIISSLDRTLPTRNHRTVKSIIQTDAAINPGSSGGPLLDSHGRLIGMNTAIASATGQSAGVGFAIPVANVARVVPQLIERGRVIRPDAGIIRVHPTEHGLLIATLAPGGPAEQAGLRGFKIVKQRRRQGLINYETQSIDRSSADLVVAVDGQKVVTVDDFLSLIEARRPGQEITITVVRAGREVSVPVRLGAGES